METHQQRDLRGIVAVVTAPRAFNRRNNSTVIVTRARARIPHPERLGDEIFNKGGVVLPHRCLTCVDEEGECNVGVYWLFHLHRVGMGAHDAFE